MTAIPRVLRAALALTFVLLASLVQAAPGVRAWLDRDTMQLGETVTLNVESGEANGAAPDFSPLRRDFELTGTQSSQQVSIVNGVSTAKTLWAVGLEPKHDGRFTIPSLTVGGAQTAPLELTVQAPSPAATPQPGGDVFLEVAAEPLTPYVQQQVRYTVKLYYAFDLTDGNLGEPNVDGLSVQRLGQDRSYLATLGARRYHVVERRYALTPERSGTLEIPAIAFRGTALDASDPTGFFSRGRVVTARSQALTLEVRPKPATWTDAPWLPAESVLLKDDSDLPDEVHVGDPVTRTLRLQAQGLGYEQLPEPTLAAPAGADVYPDKAETRTRDDGAWLYGERVRKFAFVPNRPGTLTIPGLAVRWWNTQADRAEVAELPPRTITVLPAAGSPSASGTSLSQAAPASGAAAATPIAAPEAPHAASPRVLRAWQALALAGFALWLATLALWWRAR
ncbi:MAG: protein BatD, partial [Rhodanobacteraceae bacterium]|nr:protein BatD [Rhodanobacteraceae bacterium]